MAGISIREFGRRDGCDDKLVRRAIQSGRLTALPDGTIDPALVNTGWRKTNRRLSAAADPHADKTKKVRASKSAPSESVAAGQELPPDVESDLETFVARLLAGQFATLIEAERVKENALALKHVLAARREAGSLIEIEAAESVVFQTFRAARDAWQNWPVRVGPLIAADLGLEADKVTEVLTAHVHQHLADLGEPAADFTDREG
jgi:hypothetical protein